MNFRKVDMINKKILESKGQALIEFILFLPLLIGIYSFVKGYAQSIFSSINQQKIIRSYFYYRIQNSSMFPVPATIQGVYQNWNYFSVFFIGWMDYNYQDYPIMSCYKPDIFFNAGENELCQESYSEKVTPWVKVGSVYGVCGASYYQTNGNVYLIPEGKNVPVGVISDQRSCIIQ